MDLIVSIIIAIDIIWSSICLYLYYVLQSVDSDREVNAVDMILCFLIVQVISLVAR